VSATDEIRNEVAAIARLLSAAGLVQAFGHVSARLPSGGFAITSTDPMLAATSETVLQLDAEAHVLEGEHCPLEAPLHAAIYAARGDVQAICRTHSPYAAAWAARAEPLPLVHGLGGISGDVALHLSPQLVCNADEADRAVEALSGADCLLMLANGALCTGTDLAQAATRAWFLEERAAVVTLAPTAAPLAGPTLAERSQHFEVESRRGWQWLRLRFARELTGAVHDGAHRDEPS